MESIRNSDPSSQVAASWIFVLSLLFSGGELPHAGQRQEAEACVLPTD